MTKPKKFVVSVRDFGAKGDGISDDTQAFTLARRSLADRIKVPPGHYVISHFVTLDRRFKIKNGSAPG